MIETIYEISRDFFDKLWFSFSDLEVISNLENVFTVKLKSSDSWFLIWNHWQNLESILRILKLLIVKKLWEKTIIHIEINDYLKSKDDRLISLVKSKIELINRNWKEIIMPVLSAYERKIVHGIIWELWWWRIYTKSIWEGKDRRIHIYKVDKRITLDIDSNDI